MVAQFFVRAAGATVDAGIPAPRGLRRFAVCGGLAFLLAAPGVRAQVITIDSQGQAKNGVAGTVDRRFAQVKPTNVQLSDRPMDGRTKTDLIRSMEAEQGFAMRPIPRGHKGLTLEANGKLDPAGEPYLDMVTANGLCARPGDRVVITDLKFDHNKLIVVLNGGPDFKHRFLRHIQLGTGNVMNPVVQDDGDTPQGARVTLSFKGRLPELASDQVKALLAPLISFDQKTPIQAYTDTLPPVLKQAILDHKVMVGMNTDMVLFALGRPQTKLREMDEQMPIEIWIYGKAPDPVQFVRINGNRVIRVEIATVGEPPHIFTKDEVSALMRTDGTPAVPEEVHTRTIAMGDTNPNPDTQAPAPPPTLRGPGEKLPQDSGQDRVGAMGPVLFPKQKPDDYPDATNLPRMPAQPDKTQSTDTKADKSQAKDSQPDKDKPNKAKTDQQQPAPTAPSQIPASTQPD